MLNIDFDQLRRQLLLTQAYCEQQLAKTHENPAATFRSINPVYNGKNIFEFGLDPYGANNQYYYYSVKWGVDPYFNNTDLIEELYHMQLAQKQDFMAPASKTPTIKGDIFVFSMDETLLDGAAAVESDGFLDDYNCPPIDTWFYMTGPKKRRLLLAWVPELFMKVVDDGICVNPEGCIDWFRNWHPAEYDLIIHSLTKSE